MRGMGEESMKKTKLFCIPYAGGSAMAYTRWKKHLSSEIELYPLELSGRGRKIKMPFYDSIHDAINDVFSMLEKELDDTPYALFGHSMGSVIAYEVAHKINESGCQKPMHIFFSGRKAPDAKRDSNIHHLPHDEFVEKVLDYGGMSKGLLAEKQLLDLMLPIIRNDIRIIEQYNYVERPIKLSCDTTVLYGKMDKMTINDAIEWKKHTEGKCDIKCFGGGHFFINEYEEDVIEVIQNALL